MKKTKYFNYSYKYLYKCKNYNIIIIHYNNSAVFKFTSFNIKQAFIILNPHK